MGWAAHPTRKIESQFSIPIIQMGARVYLPTLGRFLQVDPVLGGTANAYVYVSDPVNNSDYSGNLCFSCILKKVAVAVVSVATASLAVTVTGTSCVASLGLGCAAGVAAGSGIVGLGTMVAHGINSAGTANFNKGAFVQTGALGSLGGSVILGGSVLLGVFTGAASSSYDKYLSGMTRSGTIQNTARIQSAMNPSKYRVPDILNKSTIGEVKNVQYQPLSLQIRDYSAIAQRDGLNFVLKVNDSAVLSGPLMQAQQDGLLEITRY